MPIELRRIRHTFERINRSVHRWQFCRQTLGSLCLVVSVGLVGCINAVHAVEPLTDAESRRLLIDGEVLDYETNQPVQNFRVIPGVRYNAAPGTRGNLSVWQPHMIREMSGGVFQWPRTRGYDEMRFRIEADGYRAATTTWLGKGGPHLRMKIHMRPDAGIDGVVVSPDGKLAAGATLAIGLPNRSVRLDGYKVVGHGDEPLERLSDQWRRPLTVQANDQGEFLLPYESDPSAVLCVVHQSGYLEQSFADWSSSLDESSDTAIMQLEPWAQIHGQVLWKDEPGQDEVVKLTVHRNEPYPGLVESYARTTSDQEGQYRFAFVPPGHVQLGHLVQDLNDNSANATGVIYEYPQTGFALKPGQIKVIDFGGSGFDVVGQLDGLESYTNVTLSICPPAPNVWNNQRFGGKPMANGLQKGYAILRKSDYAHLYFRDSIPVGDDGRFRIRDVMTGQYNLWVRGATGSGRFELMGVQKTPFDIGTIDVKALPAAAGLKLPGLKLP